MPRAFRFTSPVVGPQVLDRPRLLERLAQRWEHRVVAVTAGAGFGKTTLLAQAAEDNALAPRGTDVWLTCEPSDAAGVTLARDLAQALGLDPEPEEVVEAAQIAEAVWQRAPDEVAILLDDVHHIPAGSPGARALDELVAAMPANGHLVLASRANPPVRLARLSAQGAALRIDEDALRLSSDELTELADQHGVPADTLEALGGWPALVELALTAPEGTPQEFVWEEVLHRFTPEDRRAFAALVAVGGGDEEVAAAAAGRPVDLDQLLDGVPLVARRASGAAVPHSLWAEVTAADLTDDERKAAQRHAATVLHAQGGHARAIELLAAAGDWPAVSAAIVEACLEGRILWVDRLSERWLALLPAAPGFDAERRLLEGLQGRVRRPRDPAVVGLLQEAAAGFAARGHLEGEVAALAHLGYLGWLAGDATLVGGAIMRMVQLEQLGSSTAEQFRRLGMALLAGDAGDDHAALTELEGIHAGRLNLEWSAAVSSLLAMTLTNLGRPEEAIAHAERASGRPEIEGMRVHGPVTRWCAGLPAQVLEALPMPGLDSLSAYDRLLAALATSMCLAHAGRATEAEAMLDRARSEIGSFPDPLVGQAADAVAVAALSVAQGAEQDGAAALRDFLADHPLDDVPVERALRWWCAIVYVLVPETRPTWDSRDYGPAWNEALAVARALVAVREGDPPPSLRCPPGRVLTSLPLPMAVELALGLAEAGDELGNLLLGWLVGLLGRETRPALRSLGENGSPMAAAARRTLSSTPVPPAARVRLAVLGPSELHRGAVAVTDPDWRRERVRLLLLYLVVHRRASREEVAAALWPEFDADASARNLRTTLNYLQRVLEPERSGGDAPFFVRQDGAHLVLHADDQLTVDAWDFEALLDEAADREAAGVASAALARLLEALALWRGDYLADARYEEWANGHRDRLRARFVSAGLRAGELLLAAGRGTEAVAVAEQVLATEPWSEAAYRVLVRAHIDTGDRASARRAVDRCLAMLDELDAGPEAETDETFSAVHG